MYSLGVSDHVMIAHSFADPFFGPAQRLHGATYAVEIELRTEVLNAHQVVMDIGALRTVLRHALQSLDYRNLDDHPGFLGRLSTTEAVARYVADQVAAQLKDLPPDGAPLSPGLLRALLRESPVAWAAYERPI